MIAALPESSRVRVAWDSGDVLKSVASDKTEKVSALLAEGVVL
ncbi:MAG: hypothetical protein ACYTGF_14230 [Planctomycetota bacterium]|jgi:hypothetical protein